MLIVIRNTYEEKDETDHEDRPNKEESNQHVRTPDQFSADGLDVRTNHSKEHVITFDSRKLWRWMRTFWKAYEVYISMQEVPYILVI